ncbi:MAG: extracellular solute-binding protein, partial [Lachnospiraceae bacterium]|nr:extracellular solute-binding protein [Lachnospiraceae bacterium]
MKKLISLLLVSAMAVTMTACAAAPAVTAAPDAAATEAAETTEAAPAAESADSGDAITLDVIICQYGPNTNDWFLRGSTGMNGTSFVDKFEAENPDIKLNLEVVSWNDVYTVVDTRIANNNAPDILNIDVFANYANEGLLLPVKDYCPEDLYNDFFPSFIDQSVIDDTVWAVPDLASARALFYNVDMLEEVGVDVPTTWSELRDVSQAIIDYYDGDVYPWGID